MGSKSVEYASLTLLQKRHSDAASGERFVDEGVQLDQKAGQPVHADNQEGVTGSEVLDGFTVTTSTLAA